MATSDLYKMGRLLDLEQFKVRVKAAVLQYASQMTLGGTASESKNFAIYILKNPRFEEVSMIALVAADPAVLAQVSITGDLADVEALDDAAVKTVVAAKWALVATKYPVTAPVV